MPKTSLTINDFSGGLSTDKSSRDLDPNELSTCENVDPSSRGKIISSHVFSDDDDNFTDFAASAPVNGTGLFVFSNDKDVSANDANDDDFIIKYAGSNGIDIHELHDKGTHTDITGSDNVTDAPQFYTAEGDLYIVGSIGSTLPIAHKYHLQNKYGAGANHDWLTSAINERTQPVVDLSTRADSTMDIQEDGSTATSADSLGANDIRWIIKYGANDTGLWSNTHDSALDSGLYYEFAGSFLYKNDAESELTPLGTGSSNGTKVDGTTVAGILNAASHVDASLTVQAWTSHAPTAAALHQYGARLYARKNLDKTWYLLAEINFEKGIRADGEVGFTNWITGADDYSKGGSPGGYQATSGNIEAPPNLITFESNNGYDVADHQDNVYWKFGVVANARAYVANVQHGSRIYGDRILKSPVFQYDVFAESLYIDVASNDGDEITALTAYGDMLLEFKKKKLFLINISKEVEYIEDVKENAGVESPSQICKTPFGVAWVNYNGAYLYNGSEVTQLTMGKISDQEWNDNIGKVSSRSICGYDPINRQLVILWDGRNAYLSAANRFNFVDGGGSADTITDSSSGFVTAGFKDNDKITISGTSNNNGDFQITTAAAGTLTLATGTLTAEDLTGAGTTTTFKKTDRGKGYVFTFDTGTWHYVSDLLSDPTVNCTNMVNTSDGKLLIGGGTANNEISVYQARGGTHAIDLRTGQLSLGDPGSKKTLTNVKVRYKNGGGAVNVSIITNDDSDDIGTTTTALSGALDNTSGSVHTKEYSTIGIDALKGQYWFQVKIAGSNAAKNFELDEIVLTYRNLGIR